MQTSLYERTSKLLVRDVQFVLEGNRINFSQLELLAKYTLIDALNTKNKYICTNMMVS